MLLAPKNSKSPNLSHQKPYENVWPKRGNPIECQLSPGVMVTSVDYLPGLEIFLSVTSYDDVINPKKYFILDCELGYA